MPYLKEAEDDKRDFPSSKIERGYELHKAAKPKTNKMTVILSRIIFLAVFVSLAVPYCIKTFAKPIYFGKFINRGLKIEAKKPSYDKIEIQPILNVKNRAGNVADFVSPTLDYLHNGTLFGVNFIAKPKEKSKMFTHIKTSGKMNELENRIEAISKNYPELKPRVFVFNYKNGKTAEVNSDVPVPLASTVKIPVLFEMFRQIESKNRNLSIDKEIIFEDVYRSSGSGDLQYSQKNGKYSIDRIANLMITKSDNSATNLILDEIGGKEDLNRAYRAWGLKTARISNWLPDLGGTNKMSMKEMGEILYNLDNPKFLKESSREKIKEYMGSLPTHHLLRAGIGDDAGIIHKTGDIGRALSDCGIVTLRDGNKYIITVVVERPHNNHRAKTLIEEISRTVYNYISNI